MSYISSSVIPYCSLCEDFYNVEHNIVMIYFLRQMMILVIFPEQMA